MNFVVVVCIQVEPTEGDAVGDLGLPPAEHPSLGFGIHEQLAAQNVCIFEGAVVQQDAIHDLLSFTETYKKALCGNVELIATSKIAHGAAADDPFPTG